MGTRYFLPEALKSTLEDRSADTISFEPSVVMYKGMKVPGFILTGEEQHIHHFMATNPLTDIPYGIMRRNDTGEGLHVVGEGASDRGYCSIISLKPFVGLAPGFLGFAMKESSAYYKVVDACLSEISLVTGCTVRIHVPRTITVQPWPLENPHEKCFIFGSPPGDSLHMQPISTLCGLSLETEDTQAHNYVGAYGREGIVRAGDSVIGQILDGFMYVFIPYSLSHFGEGLNKPLMESFTRKVLAEIWNAQYEDLPIPVKVPVENADTLHAFMQEVLTIRSGAAEASLTDILVELKSLDLRRHELLLQKRLLMNNAMVEGIAAESMTAERCAAELERIQAVPGIASLSIVDKGIHAETEPIVIEHEGTRTDVGTFVMRLSFHGELTIWPSRTTHPYGISHPHIGESGSPCFGNLTVAISDAANELEVAKTFRLALRWLTEGYDPALAETKIEDWHSKERT